VPSCHPLRRVCSVFGMVQSTPKRNGMLHFCRCRRFGRLHEWSVWDGLGRAGEEECDGYELALHFTFFFVCWYQYGENMNEWLFACFWSGNVFVCFSSILVFFIFLVFFFFFGGCVCMHAVGRYMGWIEEGVSMCM
jgi:hypothetical protein